LIDLDIFFLVRKMATYTRQQLRDMSDDTTVKDEVQIAFSQVLHVARQGMTEYMYSVNPEAWNHMQKIVDGLKILFPDSEVSLYSSNLIRIAW
jgi:hypothetical protein